MTMEKRLGKDGLTKTVVEQGERVENNPKTRSSCWVSLQIGVLWIGFALFALFGWARMIYTIQNWRWLVFSGVRPGPQYLVITGALWGLVGTAALVWMILHRPWHRLAGLAAALFFAATYWIDRLFIADNPEGKGTFFASFFTFFLLAYVVLVLRPIPELRSLLDK
jgi:hypothetical protein